MDMGIKHGIKDENGREWETTSMGMEITWSTGLSWEFNHRDFLLRLAY